MNDATTSSPLSPGKRILRAIVLAALILVVGGGGFLAFRNYASIAGLQKSLAAWEMAQGGMAKVQDEFPDVSGDPAMLELEQRAAVCGIDIAPMGAAGRAHAADDGAAIRLLDLSLVIADCAAAEGSPPALPGPVLDWLQQQDAGLRAAAEALNADPLPVPDRKVADVNAPIQGLAGMLHLARALALHAMWQLDLGDPVGAQTSALAVHRLAQSLRAHPALVFQLTGIEAERIFLVAAENMPPSAALAEALEPVWSDDGIVRSVGLDGYVPARQLADFPTARALCDYYGLAAKGPLCVWAAAMARDDAAAMLEGQTAWLKGAASADPCTSLPEVAPLPEPKVGLLGSYAPSANGARYRVRRLRAEQRWVRAILAAKEAAADPALAADPAALAAKANEQAAQDCLSCKVEAAHSDTGIALSLTGVPSWGDGLKGHTLARRFVLVAPGPGVSVQ